MSERILDFEKAHEVAAGVPLYEHSDAYCAALEAQAQARLAWDECRCRARQTPPAITSVTVRNVEAQ